MLLILRAAPIEIRFGLNKNYLTRHGCGKTLFPCYFNVNVPSGRGSVLRFCIRPVNRAFVLLGHYGYPRASDLILCKALEGQMGRHGSLISSDMKPPL